MARASDGACSTRASIASPVAWLAGDGPAQVGERRAEAGRVRPEHLGHGAHHVEAVGAAPQHRGRPEGVDEAGQGAGGAPEQRRGLVEVDRVAGDDERLQHLQVPAVEAVERALHAGPGAGPRRERGEVGRRRPGQVGAAADQGPQLVVAAPADVVGEAPDGGGAPGREGGHPPTVIGPGPVPCRRDLPLARMWPTPRPHHGGTRDPSAPVVRLRHVLDVPLLGDTIGDNLDRTVARFPDREALVDVPTGRRWTYAELGRRRSTRWPAGCSRRGSRKGDRVGIWAPNCAEWVLVQYATAKIGAILVNINPAYRSHELEYVLNQSGCRAAGQRASAFKTLGLRAR